MMCRRKRGYDLDERQGTTISYLQNDNKMVSKIRCFTNAMAGLVTRLKLYRESMANYQDKDKCPKISNSLIRGNAKSDSEGMK